MSQFSWGSFANPWMLCWGLAAAIPILIHLWSRRQQDEVRWAAVQFLVAAVQKESRRLRVEQWLLLAIRIAVLLVLALALANPLLSRSPLRSAPGTEATTHWVIVLDTSFSMAARAGQHSCLELARERAAELIQGRPQGDGFTLIGLSDPPRVIIRDAVFDQGDVIAELENLEIRHTVEGGTATLSEVERTVDRVARLHPRLTEHKVVFFTDLGLPTWQEMLAEAARAKFADLSVKAELFVELVEHGGANNAALTHLSAPEPWPAVGEQASLRAAVRNYGKTSLRTTLELFVDGRSIGQQEVELAADGEETLAFSHRFAAAGQHVVEARIHGDDLAVDDRRWLSLEIPPVTRVLCVEGQLGEAEFVALALAPVKEQHGRIQPDVIRESSLMEVDLRDYHCVVLCNLGRFRAAEVELLRGYVRDGGGLVTILGSRVQSADYNRVLAVQDGETGWLPARLAGVTAVDPAHFDPLEYKHPIVAPFRGHERSGLLSVPVWRYVQLTPDQSEAQIALRFSDGSPALVTAAVGRGRSVLLATAVSPKSVDASTAPPTPWSALPLWPCFPPLIREMVDYAAAGRAQRRNAIVGDVISGSIPAGITSGRLVLEDPGQSSHVVPIDFDLHPPRWTHHDTMVSGIYQLLPGRPNLPPQVFAVNVDNTESDLSRVDSSALPGELAMWRGGLARDTAADQQQAAFPLFRILLAILLILMVTESTLAKWISEGAG